MRVTCPMCRDNIMWYKQVVCPECYHITEGLTPGRHFVGEVRPLELSREQVANLRQERDRRVDRRKLIEQRESLKEENDHLTKCLHYIADRSGDALREAGSLATSLHAGSYPEAEAADQLLRHLLQIMVAAVDPDTEDRVMVTRGEEFVDDTGSFLLELLYQKTDG